MSKSLGNSPDPLDLIAKYGADSVRVAMMLCSSAGNDIMFDESLIEQGRNFGNKIWNTFRLLKMWEVSPIIDQPESSAIAVQWFDSLLNKTIAEINEDFGAYRISDALMKLYKLFWDDFSATYLEIIKPAYQSPIDADTMNSTLEFYEILLQQLHPYMPFITEEIWHLIRTRESGQSIMISRYAPLSDFDNDLLEKCEVAMQVVTNVRNIRAHKNIAQKEQLVLQAIGTVELPSVIRKLSNLSSIDTINEKPVGAASFIVKSTEYFIPLDGAIDKEAEIDRLTKELAYTKGFLESVMKKLSNERFVQNAPAKVLEIENTKRDDAESKIVALENQIQELLSM